MKDLILTGLRNDENTPIIRFLPRSHRFTIDLKKDLSKSKLIGNKALYRRLWKAGILTDYIDNDKHKIYQLNTDKIESMLYDFEDGAVAHISLTFKRNGVRIGGYVLDL
ncbi:MAG: hypothetical protein QW478_05000 [Candidatus Micrarchaeaceae archaeon]